MLFGPSVRGLKSTATFTASLREARQAAYLDLAVQKLTLGRKECGPGKILLERIVAMLSRM